MAEYGKGHVEERSIDWIPIELRHGSPRSLFTLWFGANMQVIGVVTGALGVVFGLPLPWAIVGVVVGNLVGTVFMALHSAQGPKLGVPQMIQSRAQFGFYGAAIPLVLVILMYIGFYASGAVLGGQALHDMASIPISVSIVLIAVGCTLLTVFGYRFIHGFARWVSAITALAFAYLTIELLVNGNIGAVWHLSGFAVAPFLLTVTVAATYQITYAPYVADYSRYLPESTSTSSCFWWTYTGAFVGTTWMMVFGAIAAAVAAKAFSEDFIGFIVHRGGGAAPVFDFVVILGLLIIGALNLYSAFMSSVTIVSSVWRQHVGMGLRAGYIIVIAVIGTTLAVAGRGSFVTSYEQFIIFLSYFIVPWTAVNLVDYYIIRNHEYDIPALFDPNGGYGKVRWQGLVPYFIGVACEIPFMNTVFYVGPLSTRMNGADISWILGVIVTGVLYLVAMRVAPVVVPAVRPVTPRSDDVFVDV